MSRIRANQITNQSADGAPTVQNGLVISGVTTSTTFSGSGASLTNLNASNIASGTVPTARLGSGTASSSTFLAGDSTYKTVTGTTINNNADNRVITGSGTANTLEGESQLLFTGTNLGVGNRTSSPDERLHVHTSSGQANIHVEGATDGQIILRSHGGDSVIHFGDASATSVGKILYDHGTDSLQFNTNSNERLRITSAGYVGINQTSPVRPLHITGNDGGSGATSGNSDTTIIVDNAGTNGSMIEFLNANNGAGHLMFTDTDATNRGRISYHHNGDYFRFDTSGSERLRIDTNGFVTTPSQPSFRATKSGSSFNTGGGVVVWDQNQHNTGSNYNTSNGRFTAPVNGTYIFHYYSIYTGNSGNDLFDFRKNGSVFAGSRMHFTSGSVGGSWDNVTNTQILTLSANDYVDIYASDQGLHGGDWSHFCGHLLG